MNYLEWFTRFQRVAARFSTSDSSELAALLASSLSPEANVRLYDAGIADAVYADYNLLKSELEKRFGDRKTDAQQSFPV